MIGKHQNNLGPLLGFICNCRYYSTTCQFSVSMEMWGAWQRQPLTSGGPFPPPFFSLSPCHLVISLHIQTQKGTHFSSLHGHKNQDVHKTETIWGLPQVWCLPPHSCFCLTQLKKISGERHPSPSSGKTVAVFQYRQGNSSPHPAGTLQQAAAQSSLSQIVPITTFPQLCLVCQQSSETPAEMTWSGARKPFPKHCRSAEKTSVSQASQHHPPHSEIFLQHGRRDRLCATCSWQVTV